MLGGDRYECWAMPIIYVKQGPLCMLGWSRYVHLMGHELVYAILGISLKSVLIV